MTASLYTEQPSPISPNLARYGSLIGPIFYVAPFYLSHTLKTSTTLSRDDPRIIRARVRAVAITCVICIALASSFLTVFAGLSMTQTLRSLGAYSFDIVEVVRAVLLTAILFIGPLYEQIIVERNFDSWTIQRCRESLWDSWTGYRNLIVAPVSEELVFRSFVIALYLAAECSAGEIIFGSPLVFGVAHLHHLVDFLRTHTPYGQRSPPARIWIMGIVRSLVQFAYTSLFGFFAAFVFLRTGNVLACIAVHMFCNWQGVPRVWGRVGDGDSVSAASRNVTVISQAGQAAGNMDLSRKQEHAISPTIIYYVLLLAGAYAFAITLWPLTESTNSLIAW